MDHRTARHENKRCKRRMGPVRRSGLDRHGSSLLLQTCRSSGWGRARGALRRRPSIVLHAYTLLFRPLSRKRPGRCEALAPAPYRLITRGSTAGSKNFSVVPSVCDLGHTVSRHLQCAGTEACATTFCFGHSAATASSNASAGVAGQRTVGNTAMRKRAAPNGMRVSVSIGISGD